MLGQFTTIHQRPAAVTQRLEFGHWEGDLTGGARNRSALVTLIERVSRTQAVLNLPDGYLATKVAQRLDQWAATKPGAELVSLTWDRGSEMADWPALTMTWGIDVYFADPHSSWQRGANENGNRQLRFWLPKSTDLTTHAQPDLDHICHTLNTQPDAASTSTPQTRSTLPTPRTRN